MLTNEDSQGVSNCYVFKSRLQEYAQKVGLPTPVYETIKEGPSHQPSFRSTVIVNNIRYDSLPGFFNRKAAEQSAAEVALVELAKSDEVNQSITQPVIETGLCKNLLQEYAQKMNYAMPLYLCKKDERPGRLSSYSCTVEIGGIRYIGASARTKKEAEIKAARTALLAIQSSASHSSEKQFGHSKLTVVPCKKRGAESVAKGDETSKIPKSKKTRFKRRPPKRKQSGDKKGRNRFENTAHVGVNISHEVESHVTVNDESSFQTMESRPLAAEAMKTFDNGMSVDYQNEKDMLAGEGSLFLNSSKIFENRKSTELQSNDFCVQAIESRSLAAEAMENFDHGMSIDYQNEKGMLAGEGSLSLISSSVFDTGKSTEVQSNESCVQTMESRPLTAEATKNSDDRMSIDFQNDKGELAGEGSLSLNGSKIFKNRKSTELQFNESCVQTMESRPLSAEAVKNFDDGMSVDCQNERGTLSGAGSLSLNSSKVLKNGMSTELQYNESCVQTMEFRPLAAEAMKNIDDGMSVDYQNENGALAGEGSLSLSSSTIFENKKLTELQSNESCVQKKESRPLAAEAMKNLDNGMSFDYQNEKGMLAGEGSLSLNSSKIFEIKKSTELQSNESCFQTMESRPLAVEAMKNFDDGMSVDYQNEKGTMAGEGSLFLNIGKVFENGKSTELQSNGSSVQAMESRPLAAEAMKKFDDGMSVDYQNGTCTLAGEGSLCLNSREIFENGSTDVQSNEKNLGTLDVQVSVLPNGDTREMSIEVNDQQFNGDMGSVTDDCVVESSISISESNPLEEKIQAEADVC